MNSVTQAAITAVQGAKTAFCKFISANDAGETGAHQAGFYMPKPTIPLMFDSPGVKGDNKERFVEINWYDYQPTQSRFVYYGKKSRNEYRLTRFGKGFPYLTENNVGDLFILAHTGGEQYAGFVLQSDDDIEDFFAAFNLSSGKTNALIEKATTVTAEDALLACFNNYLQKFAAKFPSPVDFSSPVKFPETKELASHARQCFVNAHKKTSRDIQQSPDAELLNWLNAEFELFKVFENDRYGQSIKTPFTSVEELVKTANSILNRRKSRAGKSLEHHLAEVFKVFDLAFDEQAVTEDNKTPDFIFPGANAYHNAGFDSNKLIILASKTTCKDRWRQVVTEADRVPEKHLFTLQQGISANQLKEMSNYGVRLVVPKPYVDTFPKEYRSKLFTLDTFVELVREKQRNG